MKGGGKRSWGAERRLEFLEFQLYWEGSINRRDITERFGVSTPQASNDLGHYREIAPQNIEYDASAKRYVATPAFKPIFLKPNPDRYLTQLKGIALGILKLADTSITCSPDIAILPSPVRRIDPDVLRQLLTAIRDGNAIDIRHQSMSRQRPDPFWRTITPHGFASDGFRWHVRGWCHIDEMFKDFVLSRILSTGATSAPRARSQDDWRWHSAIDVTLAPNPQLTESERHAIAVDFGMTDGKLTVSVRLSLLRHFDKHLRSGFGLVVRAAPDTPAVVVNRREYEAALRRTETPDMPPRKQRGAM